MKCPNSCGKELKTMEEARIHLVSQCPKRKK